MNRKWSSWTRLRLKDLEEQSTKRIAVTKANENANCEDIRPTTNSRLRVREFVPSIFLSAQRFIAIPEERAKIVAPQIPSKSETGGVPIEANQAPDKEKGRAKIFMSTDLAIIASYFLGKSFNRWYIDRYTAFGVLHAGADMNGKDYAYIVNMSNFDSMEDYNHDLMIHHNGNYFDDVYEDPSYDWNWDSSSNRNKFNDMRESSLIAEKIAEFAVAGLISDLNIIDKNEIEKIKEKPIKNSANQDIGKIKYLL